MANPFVCNCGLKWLKSFLKQGNLATGNPKCSTPDRYKDIAIANLDDSEFKCDTNQNTIDECNSDLETIKITQTICPSNCTCSNGIVRCSHLGLKQIPNDIPTDVREL